MNLTICSCCQNVRRFLPGLRANFEKILKDVKGYNIVFFENDSRDGTLEYLLEWQKEDDERVKVLTQSGLDHRFPSRTVRLAYCRNQILKVVRGLPNEYTLVIDADNVASGPEFSVEGFWSNFQLEEPWDVVCANSIGRYYDIWALRTDECPGDCWRLAGRYGGQIGPNNAHAKYVGDHQKEITKVTRVDSAFGGAAVYKTSVLQRGVYIGDAGCEHVPFHRMLNARIYINPKFIIGKTADEHIRREVYHPVTENDCAYVCSRGIAKRCYARNKVLQSSSPHVDVDLLDDLYDGATVYVCNTALPNFIENFLPRLKNKIVLYSGDSDDTVGFYKELLESDKIIKWYAQNCVWDHPKLVRLPIGLDYHTLLERSMEWGPRQLPVEQERDIVNTPRRHPRKKKCYSNWHFQLQRGDRQEAFDEIPRDLIDYEERLLPRLESHRRHAEYAFVASPYGGGPDCHRTWEALALGCIPIFKSCGLDPLFEGLPVIIVKKWSDVTEELLSRPVTGSLEKLRLDYWIGA